MASRTSRPREHFVVVDANTLAFGEIRSPKTLKNLRERSSLEVNFVDPLSRKGFRAKGIATIHERGSSGFQDHINRFERWGTLADRIRNVVLIEVDSAAPLSSPAYDEGATEGRIARAVARDPALSLSVLSSLCREAVRIECAARAASSR